MLPQLYNRCLEIEQLSEATVVRFTPRKLLHEQTIDAIGEQLGNLLETDGRLVLNFRNIERLSSRMVAKLITLQRKARAAGGRIVLCHVEPSIQEVFEIVKLPRLLSVYAEEQEALQSF